MSWSVVMWWYEALLLPPVVAYNKTAAAQVKSYCKLSITEKNISA